jgi:putative ABC transport system permease protein
MGDNDRDPGALLRSARGVVMYVRQLRSWLVRIFGLFHRARREREFAEELESHLAMHIEDNLRAGMTPEEARRVALIKLGGVTLTEERRRQQGGLPMLETLWQDLRYGARMLLRQPGVTSIAVMALALGIGANTAIFSVVNAVLLRPLNYADSERLVMINHHYPKNNVKASVSAVGYSHYRDHSQSFESIGALAAWSPNLTGSGDPERLNGMSVTHSFLPMLGAKYSLGRAISADDDQPGKNQVVVLSDAFWRRRFGGDPEIVGKTILLNGVNHSVIGVTAPGYEFGREFGPAVELWRPIAFTQQLLDPRRWRNETLTAVIAKLKPGVSFANAQREMDTIAANVRQTYFEGKAASPSDWGLALQPLRELVVGGIRSMLLFLVLAVGLVLLIACANVANLSLSRAAVRGREMAVRGALGADRSRMIRQLLTESVLLAALGGALGMALAYGGVRLLLSSFGEKIPRGHEIGVDAIVLLFTFGLSLMTGVLFGMVPALQGSKIDLSATLKEGGRSVAGRSRLRNIFVVAQVAISLAILIVAGLMLKSLERLQEVDPGFRPQNLLTMQVSLPQTRFRDTVQIDNFFEQILAKVKSLPGVQGATLGTGVPMSGVVATGRFRIEGRTVEPGETDPWGDRWAAGAEYFQTMEIPLIRGRYFDQRDIQTSTPVAIIDETLRKKFWANEDPIGKRISFRVDPQGNPIWSEIVGVVGHVKTKGLEGESPAQYYFPHRQQPASGAFLITRTAGDPSNLAASVRGAIQSVDRELPVFRVTTMERLVSGSVAQRRLAVILLGVFALVAMVLATVGIYGVMSYSVAQRTNEIGLRVALGAKTMDVLGMVLRQGMSLALIGSAIGLVGSFALTRVIRSMLFNVSAADPITYFSAPALLVAATFLACLIPAFRAARVNPIVALRYE